MQYLSGYEEHLIPGRSVLVKVSSVDSERKRMSVRVSEAECFVPPADSDLVYRMFTQHIEDMNEYQKWASKHPSKG